MGIEDVIRKVKKLRALAKGNENENEAAAALAAAARLMAEHQLEEITLAQEAGDETGGGGAPGRRDAPVFECEKIVAWVSSLAGAVCRATNTASLWVWAGGGKHRLVVWGRKDDAEACAYLFDYCRQEIKRLNREYRRARRRQGYPASRSELSSYRMGCVDAINIAVAQELDRFRREAQQKASGEKALVVYDRRRDEALAVRQKEFPRTKTFRSSAGQDWDARTQGRRDGASIYKGRNASSGRLGAPAPKLGTGR